MTLTLDIDDRMAEELKTWAEYHNASAEKSALELLRTALLHALHLVANPATGSKDLTGF